MTDKRKNALQTLQVVAILGRRWAWALNLMAVTVIAGWGYWITQIVVEQPRKAVTQINAEEQHLLGLIYARGEGVQQDFVKAAKWFREAAVQGHAEAQYQLSQMYRNGLGIRRDDAKADKWLLEAANQGNVEAVKWLEVEAQRKARKRGRVK